VERLKLIQSILRKKGDKKANKFLDGRKLTYFLAWFAFPQYEPIMGGLWKNDAITFFNNFLKKPPASNT
jgi:hypothetical protein